MKAVAKLFTLSSALLVACASPSPPSSPLPQSIPTETAPPVAPSPSPSPTVGTCVIRPGTSCPGADLSTAVLSYANLRNADLVGADLYGADLRHANLRNADLRDVNARKVDFTGADLRRADLTGAVLKGANLNDVNLKGASIDDEQLAGTLVCATIMPDGTPDDSGCDRIPVGSPFPTAVGPTITTFRVPPEVEGCVPGVQTVSVRIAYETERVKTVIFEIDGTAVPGDAEFGRSGVVELDFACAKARHHYTIVATSVGGRSVERTQTVVRAS